MPSITKYAKVATEESAGFEVPWAYESSIYGSGTVQAKNNTGSCATTHKLVASDFDFNLPDNAEVVGVVVNVRYANNTPLNSGCSKVHAISVSAGGSYAVRTSMAYTAGTNTNSLQTKSLGSSDSLWGSLSNDPADYISLSVRYWATVAPGYTAFVDWISVTLYYVEPSYSVSVSASSSAIMGNEFNYTLTLKDTNKERKDMLFQYPYPCKVV